MPLSEDECQQRFLIASEQLLVREVLGQPGLIIDVVNADTYLVISRVDSVTGVIPGGATGRRVMRLGHHRLVQLLEIGEFVPIACLADVFTGHRIRDADIGRELIVANSSERCHVNRVTVRADAGARPIGLGVVQR